MKDPVEVVLDVLDRNLRSIWDGDVDAYQATTSEDVSFYEWYISPQRIDGLDFHLRELRVHRDVVAPDAARIEHEILQPRVQVYGETAIVTYTLLVRVEGEKGIEHRSHNETRVFHDFGTESAPEWKLVHCHKSPLATAGSMRVLRT